MKNQKKTKLSLRPKQVAPVKRSPLRAKTPTEAANMYAVDPSGQVGVGASDIEIHLPSLK